MNISDQWETPQDLYDELDKEFDFIIDACATNENQKAEYRFNDATNDWEDELDGVLCRLEFEVYGYDRDLGGDYSPIYEQYGFDERSVFMNPPYSRGLISKCLQRAWDFSSIMTVVCLVPTRCLSCSYMDCMDELEGKGPFRKWKEGIEIRHLPRRVKFTNPHREASSPNFEVCLVIMRVG